MQKPKINRILIKNSTYKTTVPRRRLFLLLNTKKYTLLGVFFHYKRFIFWWSCGVLPPGPKGDRLSSTSLSLFIFFAIQIA